MLIVGRCSRAEPRTDHALRLADRSSAFPPLLAHDCTTLLLSALTIFRQNVGRRALVIAGPSQWQQGITSRGHYLEHRLELSPERDADTFSLAKLLRDLSVQPREWQVTAWTRTKWVMLEGKVAPPTSPAPAGHGGCFPSFTPT